ncbi:FAD-dependent oxidoreductase [Mesorhizobium sp. CN2-181]|uniref:FAD-dependent oxidoreductase n=1 Tax=Mesorhizobium yinganensis TaxID=3157707 RepID=UPI0032B7A926
MAGVVRDAVEFDMEVPVVVVGAGASGLTAALAARDAGADVFLLERDLVPRGSTCMSQGNVCAAGTKLQKAKGIVDDADSFYRDIMAQTHNTADPVIARTVADNAGPTVDWLIEKFEIPFTINTKWGASFGHSADRQHGMPTRTGGELHGALTRAAEGIGVDIIAGAHVDTVYADEDGRVRGVAFTRPDGTAERVGCQALVLTTCGFGANAEMVKKFIPAFGNTPYYRYFGHEGNEGEGIKWGMELGAAVGSMDAFQGYGALAEQYGIIANYDLVLSGGIQANARGERFSNEVADISGQALNVLPQPDGIGWIVFDDIRSATCESYPEYVELKALGAIRTGATAAELAAAIKVPVDALEKTLNEVAGYARGEAKDPFGRDFTGRPPMKGPYQAIKTTGALFHTQGGLRVNANAQVMRPDGSLLPNLFAGGGAAEGISGAGPSGYLPAAGLCTAVTLGRLAGAAAAALVKAG